MSNTIDLEVRVVPTSSLTLDPANARKHGTRNLSAIASSLRDFGQRKPLVVHGSVVVAGNGTLEAALSLGWERIAVALCPADWTLEQARAYALADNHTGDLSEWDPTVLADQLIELDAVGWDLSAYGFQQLTPPGSKGSFLDDMRDDTPPPETPFITPETYPLPYGFRADQRSRIIDAVNKAKTDGDQPDAPTALAYIAGLYLEGKIA